MTKESEVIVDYASPLINIEFMTRVVHDACLSKNYSGAKDIATRLLAETKVLVHTLTLMQEAQEQEEANRRARGLPLQP